MSEAFLGRLALPEPAVMEDEIARVRRWSHGVFPGRSEGYFIGIYIGSYVDELMRDMNLPTRRTGNVFAEHFGALWASRYEGVTEERWGGTEERAPDAHGPLDLTMRGTG